MPHAVELEHVTKSFGEMHAVDEELTPNGMPVFPIYWTNDDFGAGSISWASLDGGGGTNTLILMPASVSTLCSRFFSALSMPVSFCR